MSCSPPHAGEPHDGDAVCVACATVYAACVKIFVAVSLLLLACQSDGGAGDPAAPPSAPSAATPAEPAPAFAGATQVTFRFRDSSVPPEYHRSYAIVVTP